VTTKTTLTYLKIPRQFSKIVADLSMPIEQQLLPGMGESVGSEDIVSMFSMSMIEQKFSRKPLIFFNCPGHGLMDLIGYEDYFQGELGDCALPDEDLERFAESIAGFPKPRSA